MSIRHQIIGAQRERPQSASTDVLSITTQPSGAVDDVAFTAQPAIQLRNAGGVALLIAGVTVTASKASGSGTLAGTLTAVTNASGVATFTNLEIQGTGDHTIQFAASGYTSVTSGTVSVSASGGVLSYSAGKYCTYEPVDSNTLLADDFSRGSWYRLNYDDAVAAGELNHIDQMGWGGTIWTAINPAKAIVGGGVGLHGRTYAATTGTRSGAPSETEGLEADHSLYDYATGNAVGVSEAYFRVYFKPLADYAGGHEKMFDFLLAGVGSAQLIALGYNYFGNEEYAFIPYLYQDTGLGPSPGSEGWLFHNVSTQPTWTLGHWFYLEMRVKLNTSNLWDGEYEWWMDDCGTDGTSGPGTPTRRGLYTNIKYRGSDTGSATALIRGIWIENFANPGTNGTMYYASVYVSKAFIGFADPAHQP